jgi:2,4-dienoyl-CoA reductase-like NADH-dependent reductase (Old Yellow Enzyme family)
MKDARMSPDPLLLSSLTIRSVEMPNRIVVSPMCQYSAKDGFAGDWHFVHYGKLAVGGAGVVVVEATAVEPRGRITHGCLGLWSDEQIAPLKRIADFIREQGSVPAIQLAHAGRKGSSQLPWHGNDRLGAADAAKGEPPWTIVGPTAEAANPKRDTPVALTIAEINEIYAAWSAATRRALEAGYDIVEIHGAHGYLVHSFVSTLGNHRDDEYGGSIENRMRHAIKTAKAVRCEWPDDKPFFFRVSAVDGDSGGWSLDDTLILSRRLAEVGVDVIVCSSGGIDASRDRSVATALKFQPGFQVPYAERVRRDTGIMSMAVGLIVDPHHAEEILQQGGADMICLGRELLHNPNWPLHARVALMGDAGYDAWPPQFRWSLRSRAPWAAKYKGDRPV